MLEANFVLNLMTRFSRPLNVDKIINRHPAIIWGELYEQWAIGVIFGVGARQTKVSPQDWERRATRPDWTSFSP